MDERDDSLARLYRRSSREEPPAQVDLAVMEMARRASRRAPWSPFGNHWLATGAVAAVALVSVVLVVFMQEQSSLTALPEAAPDSVALRVPEAGREQALDDGSIRLPLPPPDKQTDSDAVVVGKATAVMKREQAELPAAQPADAPASQSGAAGAQQPRESGPPQPRFDFYKSSPEMQVVVSTPAPGQAAVTLPQPSPPAAAVAAPEPPAGTPEEMDSQATAATAGVPVPTTVAAPSAEHAAGKTPDAPPAGYYLQVGAFRAADSAARFRTRLEALQLPASVEAIELANRETWHRVRVGPYPDMAAAEAVRSGLKAQGIDSLLVKPAE